MHDLTFYRSKENKAITNSKIGDFLKSPDYYKAKWIDGTVTEEPTPAMLLGSMVDVAVSAGDVNEIYRNYSAKEKGKDPGEKTVVSAAAYEDAQAIAKNIIAQPFYKAMRKSKCIWQKPLYAPADAELVVAGIPDAYCAKARWDGGSPALIDLKVTAPMHFASGNKWLWRCRDMRYLQQLALYRHLVASELGVDAEEISCWHVVAGSTFDGKWPVKLFKFDRACIDKAFEEVIGCAHKLFYAKEFKKESVTWSKAEVIGT